MGQANPRAITGGDRQDLLAKLARYGVSDWHQVLLCLPRDYVTHSPASALRAAMPIEGLVGQKHVFSLVVSETPVVVPKPKKRIVFSATDGMMSVGVVVFIVAGVDVPYWKGLNVGDRLCIEGALQSWNGRLQITGPSIADPLSIGKTLPQYEALRGVVAAHAIFDATRHALDHHLDATVEFLRKSFNGLSESEVFRQARLVGSFRELLRIVHDPDSAEAAENALAGVRKLAAFSVVLNARALKDRKASLQSILKINHDQVQRLIQKLPYPLTSDQLRTINEIVRDLRADRPMRRIVSGDVGTGKTYCMMIPALAAQAGGYRIAILTPNMFLAEQFRAEVLQSFPDALITCVTRNKAKAVSFDGNPILVGTTALFSKFKEGDRPHLVIVDEQQRFSVGQKEALLSSDANYLEATATPIPRTAALISHGALDVSLLRECPVKKTIQTRLVRQTEVRRVMDHTRRVIESGGQVAVVYPIVRDTEQERKSVIKAFDRWEKEFPGMVCMIHGALKDQDKIDAITKFKSGQTKIGVVSSIIELGITVPAMKSLVVLWPERYGVATLHQLRGRLARTGGTGYFFMLIQDDVKDEALERLRLLERFTDGFELAEHDAQSRGYGDLFEAAERQSGKSNSTLFFNSSVSPDDINLFQKGP